MVFGFGKPKVHRFDDADSDTWQSERFREMDYMALCLKDRLGSFGPYYRQYVIRLLDELVDMARKNELWNGAALVHSIAGYDEHGSSVRTFEIGVMLSYFGGQMLLETAERKVQSETDASQRQLLNKNWQMFKLLPKT